MNFSVYRPAADDFYPDETGVRIEFLAVGHFTTSSGEAYQRLWTKGRHNQAG